MIALSDKDSGALKDKDHMRDITSKIGPYLNNMDSEVHPEIKKFLLEFTQNCIKKETIDGVDHYALNSNIRSIGEMHAILNSVPPSKEMAEGPAGWGVKQIETMSAVIEASKSLEGEAREHFFAALRLADDPKKFAALVTTLDKESEAFSSNLWRAALKEKVDPSEVGTALPKEVLDGLKDIHKLGRLGSEYDEVDKTTNYHLIKHVTPKTELYDIISNIPEGEKDPKSYIHREFSAKKYDISFNSDFTFNKEMLDLKAAMLLNPAFKSIEDDLKGARKKEDITKAIQKYEQEYAANGGRKTHQETQANILEVNNILRSITEGRDGNPLKIEDLQRLFAGGVNFDVNQAIKYKLTGKSEGLDENAKEFIDSLKTTSLITNPKAIGRLTDLLDQIGRSKETLEKNGELYYYIPGDTNNNFKSKESFDVANKLYEIVVNGNLREFPKEKAALLTLSPKMQPGSFALLTSKLQTGPVASEAVDLLTSNYKKSYESNIENFVDRTYQVCKLDNKKDRDAVLQWSMDKNVDPEKLDNLVNICNQHKHIPATEIIKLSSRSQNVPANLEHLQKACADPSLEPTIIKMCNSTGINPAALNGMYGSKVDKKNISTILAHAYEVQPHLKSKQIGDLVSTLKSMDPIELGKLAARYERGELFANVAVLTKELGPGGNITLLETDPHVKRTPQGLKDQRTSLVPRRLLKKLIN